MASYNYSAPQIPYVAPVKFIIVLKVHLPFSQTSASDSPGVFQVKGQRLRGGSVKANENVTKANNKMP